MGISSKTEKRKRKSEDAKDVELIRTKYEIAEELGLMEKIKRFGWTGLSAAECGMIGGKLGARMKQTQNKDEIRAKQNES